MTIYFAYALCPKKQFDPVKEDLSHDYLTFVSHVVIMHIISYFKDTCALLKSCNQICASEEIPDLVLKNKKDGFPNLLHLHMSAHYVNRI